MDDGVIIVLDYDKICRLCLQSKGVMSDIFDKDDEIPLTLQIKLITSVEVGTEDLLPQKVCHKCRYLVELSYELRATALKAHQLLSGSQDLSLALHEPLADLKPEQSWQASETPQDPEEGGEQAEADPETWRAPLGKKGSQDYEFDELTCQLCLEVLSGISAHLEHVEQHYSDASQLVPFHRCCKPFSCPLCPGQSFNFRKDLIIHHRVHLKINPYYCQEPGCGLSFKSKESLRHHMYSHADKKFVCEMCGAAFRRKFELGQHNVRHQDEGVQFTCKQCRVVCKNRLSFKAHMRHHETGRRFKCLRSGCPKAFFSNTDLNIHERAHSNDKCFKCPLCVCAYISQSQLNRHLRQHEKRRVHKCDKCSESFGDYTEFCNHRIRTHGEWHPHKCPACNQGYQGVRQLERHVARCPLAGRLAAADAGCMDMSDMEMSDAMFKTEEGLEGLVMQGRAGPGEEGEEGTFLYLEAEGGGEGGEQYMIIKGHHFLPPPSEREGVIKEERD